MWGSGDRDIDGVGLLEREGATAATADALTAAVGGHGGALLIEGPAGIGKTSLLGALRVRARDRGALVLEARGSEMEREFGFGIVRQLFGTVLRALGEAERAALFTGPAMLAAAIFGFAEAETIDIGPAEASLYGLFWLVAGLAERQPLVLAIDDAHWADTASLRFVHYLGRRLESLPLLLALAARPNEPGVEAEMLRGLATTLEIPTVRPALLSEGATGALVRARLGPDTTPEVTAACHRATGGNPLLIQELLAELEAAGGPDSLSADRVATIGPERIAAELTERALKLDPQGPDIARAVAILGDGTDLQTVAALAGVDPGRASSIVDRLAAATILTHGSGHGFVHPLLRSAVYDAIPAAGRALSHARAADLLAARAAAAEEVSAHLLLCEPGSTAVDAVAVLDEAAVLAAERGAPDSAAAYLRRALPEVADRDRRGALLRRLGGYEVALRDPASIEHLQEAAALAADPIEAIAINLELIELLSIAGLWEATVQTVEAALARFGGSELPGVLDLEALRAAAYLYDPARVAEYDRDLPRLRALVGERRDEESEHLRWILAAADAARGATAAEVLELLAPSGRRWSIRRRGRESSFVAQPMYALLMVGADAETGRIATDLRQEGRDGGSLLAAISGVGLEASLDSRRGRLGSAEAQLGAALELIRENDMSLMALTTVLNFCLDAIIERRGLAEVADLTLGLELPSPFGETQSGGMLAEVSGAVRMARSDRAGAVADLRRAAAIFGPLDVSPRMTRWRSRLALALPETSREEALELAAEELRQDRAIGSAQGEGIALRALGVLSGGDAGIERLRESVAVLRTDDAPLELARSLAELGAALRRGNRRGEARERLREAAELAQTCGAELLESRVGEELRIAGAKPRRQALSGTASLTPGERRVVDAAATGATNREIAQNLFVSLRTVEMHLTNSYRKLGISSRTEIGPMIAEEA